MFLAMISYFGHVEGRGGDQRNGLLCVCLVCCVLYVCDFPAKKHPPSPSAGAGVVFYYFKAWDSVHFMHMWIVREYDKRTNTAGL